jgi:hypothetical protein
MSSLLNTSPRNSFAGLLKVSNTVTGTGIDLTSRPVQDGTGAASPLSLSTTQVAINGQALPLTGVAGQYLKATSSTQMGWVASPVGTMGAQNAASVAITGGTITGLSTPVNASDAATKAYVDSLSATGGAFATGDIVYDAVVPTGGWIPANGASLSPATYPALASIINGAVTPSTTWAFAANTNVPSMPLGQSFAYGAGVYVGGSTALYTTTTGATWAARTSPFSNLNSNACRSMVFGNNLFVAGGGGSAPLLATSPDGINWTTRTSNLPATLNISCVVYGNGMFLVFKSDGSYASSTDGINWTAYPTITNGAGSIGAGYGNGKFVVGYAGTSASVKYSTDGINWTAAANNPFTNVGLTFNIAFGNGVFVAGSGTALWYSYDGSVWSSNVPSNYFGQAINGICFGAGVFVAFSPRYVATSPDGITWTTEYTYSSLGLTACAYGAGKFVLVASGAWVETNARYAYDPSSTFVVPNITTTAPTIAYIKT